MSLYKLGKADSILWSIRREVGVLEENISNLKQYCSATKKADQNRKETHEPLIRTTNVSRSDSRDAVALGVIGIHRLERDIPWVDSEFLLTKRQCNAGLGRAR